MVHQSLYKNKSITDLLISIDKLTAFRIKLFTEQANALVRRWGWAVYAAAGGFMNFKPVGQNFVPRVF